jgi:hypothetical protein
MPPPWRTGLPDVADANTEESLIPCRPSQTGSRNQPSFETLGNLRDVE